MAKKHVHQVVDWLNSLESTKRHESFSLLSPLGIDFLEEFERRLRLERTDTTAKIVGPFQESVKHLLTDRCGIKLEKPTARVELAPGLNRSCDLSFSVNGQRWAIEIKTNLEFNSLGAAVFEGLAFKKVQPKTRFVLLSLYSKPRSGDLREALKLLKVEDAFDEIIILSSNAHEGEWCPNFVSRINQFVTGLPQGQKLN